MFFFRVIRSRLAEASRSMQRQVAATRSRQRRAETGKPIPGQAKTDRGRQRSTETGRADSEIRRQAYTSGGIHGQTGTGKHWQTLARAPPPDGRGMAVMEESYAC